MHSLEAPDKTSDPLGYRQKRKKRIGSHIWHAELPKEPVSWSEQNNVCGGLFFHCLSLIGYEVGSERTNAISHFDLGRCPSKTKQYLFPAWPVPKAWLRLLTCRLFYTTFPGSTVGFVGTAILGGREWRSGFCSWTQVDSLSSSCCCCC